MKSAADQVREWLRGTRADLKVLLAGGASVGEKQNAKRCRSAGEQLEALMASADNLEDVARAIVLACELADGWRCACHTAVHGPQLERHWHSVKSGGENLKRENAGRKSDADAKVRNAFAQWCGRNRTVLAGLATAEKLIKYRHVTRLSQRDARRLGALLKAGRL